MFCRQIELLGEKNQKRLASLQALVVGAGGLGYSIAEGLSCIGLAKVVVVDFDRISTSNLHRQFGYTLSDVGKFKVEALANRLNRCSTPVIGVVGKVEKIEWEKYGLNRGKWIIFDGTDRLESRHQIILLSARYSQPWVYSGVEEWRGAVAYFSPGEGREFLPSGDWKPVSGQFPPLVGMVAHLAVGVGIRNWLGLEKPTLYYLNYSPANSLSIISISKN